MAKKATIAGNTFLFTGKLTEFTREDAEAHVEAEGGKVLSGVSAKLNYLVVGQDAGSKLAKAKALGTVTILHEKEFLKMMSSGKKTPTKTVTKTVSKKTTATMFKFKIIGSGSELAWMKLDKEQLKYWRKIYKNTEDEYNAQRELVDHIRHSNDPQYDELGYIGEYYNWGDEFEEYPYYSGSKLVIELYSGSKFLETIELPVEDERIKKSFINGYIQNTAEKNNYKKGTVFAKTEDRGEYCICEMDISEEENNFSLDNFHIYVKKIQGYQYVSFIEYNNLMLDCEPANDPHNKDFDAWIIWTN